MGIKSSLLAEESLSSTHADFHKYQRLRIYCNLRIMLRHNLTNTIAKISSEMLTTASTSRPIN